MDKIWQNCVILSNIDKTASKYLVDTVPYDKQIKFVNKALELLLTETPSIACEDKTLDIAECAKNYKAHEWTFQGEPLLSCLGNTFMYDYLYKDLSLGNYFAYMKNPFVCRYFNECLMIDEAFKRIDLQTELSKQDYIYDIMEQGKSTADIYLDFFDLDAIDKKKEFETYYHNILYILLLMNTADEIEFKKKTNLEDVFADTETPVICENNDEQTQTDKTPHYYTAYTDDQLTAIFNKLTESGYLHPESDLETWLSVCGSKTHKASIQQLKWLKQQNTLGWLIAEMFESTDNRWQVSKTVWTVSGKPFNAESVKTYLSHLNKDNADKSTQIKELEILLKGLR